MIKKVISGGQTGADQGGLAGAAAIGIPTGGWAPKGWMTEDGPAPWLEDMGLFESADEGYAMRTHYNVHDADLTVIFGNVGERGSALTQRACARFFRPCLVNPTPEELRAFVEAQGVEVINVAGNRESRNPGIFATAMQTIIEAFS